MRFHSVVFILSLSTGSTVAQGPPMCNLDEWYARTDTYGLTETCQWWVCGQYREWRMVRDCGAAATCLEGQPTTCVSLRVGKPFWNVSESKLKKKVICDHQVLLNLVVA